MQSNTLCLDTSALIELYTENEEVARIVGSYDEVYITSLTIFEFGKRKLPIDVIEEIIGSHVTITVGYDESILALQIFKSLVKSGQLIEDNDILIGAACIVHNIPLLTLNKKHFSRMKKFGLKLV